MTRAQSRAFIAPGLGWLALFLLLPCLLLLLNALLGEDGRVGLAEFARLFAPPALDLLLSGLRLAALATLVALLLGVPAAWAVARLPPRAQPLLLALVLLPFFASLLFRSLAWSLLLGPEGPVAAGLEATGLAAAPADLRGGPWTVALGLAYAYLPFVVFAVYAALARQDRRLVEASTDLGASRWRTFRRITLPLTLPGVIAGALFVFLLSLGNFLVPDLLAGRAQPTLGTAIYDSFVTRPDWRFGSALASLLVGAMLLLLLAQALLVARARARR